MSQIRQMAQGTFVRERLDGLYDKPRPGAPRQISDQQIEQVILRTFEETPRGETLEQPRHGKTWSIRRQPPR